jgi:hypothetical protein
MDWAVPQPVFFIHCLAIASEPQLKESVELALGWPENSDTELVWLTHLPVSQTTLGLSYSRERWEARATNNGGGDVLRRKLRILPGCLELASGIEGCL